MIEPSSAVSPQTDSLSIDVNNFGHNPSANEPTVTDKRSGMFPRVTFPALWPYSGSILGGTQASVDDKKSI